MLTNKAYGVFYVGVTSNLIKRVYEHKNELADGFSKQYKLKMLVYYEIFEDAENAIKREKRLKRWSREWKIEAINNFNPEWKDLYEDICK
ncbi:MAG: GIY-YIG nuclease family protein [Alphaproteobacteria bacterium]|nr:GIY-YIG nuclease family protein [Alphaproteobacteria bacterium]